jgi:hypothetical protein
MPATVADRVAPADIKVAQENAPVPFWRASR